jgi:replicative DNA helicase
MDTKVLQFEEAPPVTVGAPFSREAEDAIIGAVIINPVEIDELVIEPQDFYIRRNQVIWEALISLHRKGTGIDYVTLLDELEDKSNLELIGGSAYVAGLMANVGYVSDVKAYEKIIKSYSKRRAILSVANDVAKIAYGEESDAIDDQLGEIVSRLLKHSIPDKGLISITHSLNKLSANVEERSKNPKDIWGISTGFIDLDNYLGGLQKGEVFYLAGEPAVGKTKLAVQIALNASSDQCGAWSVGIYSLEMRDIAVARRMVSAVQEVSTRSMKSGKMSDIDWSNFFEAVGDLESRKLYLSDASMLTTSELRADIARVKANYGLDLVVLDYLLLMSGYEKLDNETERSTRLSRDIKSIAKDMDVALIAVNSVTKEGMDGGLALKKNLRGSGQLIHDADLIALLCMDNASVTNTLFKPVKLVFTKVRDVEIGTTTINLLADNARPMFHSATSQSIQL